jgi:hypothetical protein
MRNLASLGLIAMLAACNPPATDDASMRSDKVQQQGPSAPIDTPDTTSAIWAESAVQEGRIIFGVPGDKALFSLTCVESEDAANMIQYTRLTKADAKAKGTLALIGNSHVARLPIDAQKTEAAAGPQSWLWRGALPASSPSFEALTGPKFVEATVPGAGSLILGPSPLPGALIARCRGIMAPADPGQAQPEGPA